ncbi:MAG TPA: single-stranded DNA-binding protein [Candidatus Pullichristensenella avicola]|nr:single-stranded DNA-binding protein [Candidatus Pullichristensenella avicola]
MNQVYISGMIADRPRLVEVENGTEHLIFGVSVRHRTAKGLVKQEIYTVNAWNGVAQWGGKALAQGELVGIKGYLTQHRGENGTIYVEVTAEEILPARKVGRLEEMRTKGMGQRNGKNSEAGKSGTERKRAGEETEAAAAEGNGAERSGDGCVA